LAGDSVIEVPNCTVVSPLHIPHLQLKAKTNAETLNAQREYEKMKHRWESWKTVVIVYNNSPAEAGNDNGGGWGPQGYIFCLVCCEAEGLDATINLKNSF